MSPTKERKSHVRAERTKRVDQEGHFSGDSVPRPLGFVALVPIPVH